MVIRVNELSYVYGDGTKALDNISFDIKRNSKTSILGPNGSGKSTLFLHLNGILKSQEGTVYVLDTLVDKKNDDFIKAKVGLVFQDPDDQVFSFSVWEDVAFGPKNMKLTGEDINRRVEDSLKAVGMWEYKDKVPNNLSYGQKKRVAIAGILAMDCEIIVLDEPGAYLDPKSKESLFKLLDELHNTGKTIVIATHDVDLAYEWSNNIILIKDGKVLANGGKEILTNEDYVLKAHINLPTIVKIFKNLTRKTENYPVTIKKASELLNEWIVAKN